MVGNASITWLNGFLGIQFFIEKEKYYTLSLFGKNLLTNTLEKEKKEKPEGVKSNKSKSKKLKKAKKRKNKSKLKSNKDKKDINLKELIPIFKKTLSKLFKKLKPDIFKLYGIYGFRNPALTGTLSGIISIMNGFKKIRIDLSPTFLEEIIHANINIKGQFRLIDLIIIFISTIIKAPIRKLISNSN